MAASRGGGCRLDSCGHCRDRPAANQGEPQPAGRAVADGGHRLPQVSGLRLGSRRRPPGGHVFRGGSIRPGAVMPSRLGVALIVLFWLPPPPARRLPRRLAAAVRRRPAAVRIDLADEATQTVPARWAIYRGDRAGSARSRPRHAVRPGRDDTFRFVSTYAKLKVDVRRSCRWRCPSSTRPSAVTRDGDLREQYDDRQAAGAAQDGARVESPLGEATAEVTGRGRRTASSSAGVKITVAAREHRPAARPGAGAGRAGAQPAAAGEPAPGRPARPAVGDPRGGPAAATRSPVLVKEQAGEVGSQVAAGADAQAGRAGELLAEVQSSPAADSSGRRRHAGRVLGDRVPRRTRRRPGPG